MRKETLSTIIQGCKKGNRLDQKELYKHFFHYGMNVCSRYARSDAEAEEMMNDAFLRIFTKIDLYDDALSFPAWLHTIMVRSAINYLKKYHSLQTSEVIDSMTQHIVLNETVFTQFSVDEIMILVQKLPPSYRAVFNLSVVEGYSHKEIAVLMGISEGTARSNLMIARQKLQLMVSNSNQIKL